MDGHRPDLRALPAVHRIAGHPAVRGAADPHLERWTTAVVRQVIAEERRRRQEGAPARDEAQLAREAAQRLVRLARASLRRVINATGVVLHTNLGRAPLAPAAVEAVQQVAGSYSTLEFQLESGARGSRLDHVRDLLCLLTGAEDALVVNNNAAAVLLILTVLARGRQVVVSRGQLVEIGGSFRIPEILAQSGAQLVEVGTTNKTRLSDYEAAIGPETAMLLRVHPSNYRVVGFTAHVPLQDLVALGHRHGLPVMDDIGSGLLFPLPGDAFKDEPSVQASLEAGADLVSFSGDKLLGGPQAGIIVGRRRWVEPLRRHPLVRALRCDKLVLAGLEATLRLYLQGSPESPPVPVLEMLRRSPAQLAAAAQRLAEALRARVPSATIVVAEGESQAGGGSLPTVSLPTTLVGVRLAGVGAELLARTLRQGHPPVVGRVHEDTLWFDPRTLLPGEADLLVEAVAAAADHLQRPGNQGPPVPTHPPSKGA